MTKVLYTAAHSGFNLGEVPLGGGAAVCTHLVQEWERTNPFEWQVLGPSILGTGSPKNKDLVRYSELAYARFCRQFEQKLTEQILQNDPRSTVVLCNDVSEGPDFKALAGKGYAIYTIYHVDVVDYFTAIYLRSWVSPERTTAVYRGLGKMRLRGLVPDVLKLVWDKQEASVLYSKGLIVPSQAMKDVLLSCYPGLDPNKVHVLPWGVWDQGPDPREIEQEKEWARTTYPVPPGAPILLSLSRISPEKGQHRILEALALWEKESDFPKEGLGLYISGEAAYMMGKRYEKKLKELAKKLQKTRVYFVGYAAGTKKEAFFKLADLYVFPSIHESYGLTLLEAFRAGLPSLVTPSHGAKEVFRSEFGAMTPAGPESQVPQQLMEGLRYLLSSKARLKKMGSAASAWAREQRFSDTASRLVSLLVG